MPRALISTTHLAVRQSVGLPVILCVAILHNLRRAYRLRTPNLSHSRLVLFQNNGTRDGGHGARRVSVTYSYRCRSGLNVCYRLEEGLSIIWCKEGAQGFSVNYTYPYNTITVVFIYWLISIYGFTDLRIYWFDSIYSFIIYYSKFGRVTAYMW